MIDTIIGYRVATKSVDSINEYVRKTELNNMVLKSVVMTFIWKYLKCILKLSKYNLLILE